MRPSVQSQFRAFNEPFEGSIPYMYLDIKGLVTTGVGNLIDPVELATALPFRFKANPSQSASQEQIIAEWQRLKNNPALAQQGHKACAAITDLELGDDAINALIAQRLGQNEMLLMRQQAFKSFDSWPADAQLGLLSMAWAMGAGALQHFPNFSAACEQLDFKAAAARCQMNEAGNPGLAPRNRANALLFLNAGEVASQGSGLDLAALYYPRDLATTKNG